MPSGGSGRGQGRPLAAKTVEAMVRKLARTIDRLERQGEPPSVALTLAAVNLDIQAGRLLRLARMERPVPLTADAQVRAAAVVAAIEEDDTPSVALGQAPPMGGKELMMDNLVWIVKCDGPRGQAATFAVKRARLDEPGFWQDFLNGATCQEFDTEAAATAYENEMQAYYDEERS